MNTSKDRPYGKTKMSKHKHWIKLMFQVSKLYLQKINNQRELTNRSYNKISSVYDEKWTDHMNKFSKDMIYRIKFPTTGKGIDLTCGTGYVTNLIAEQMKGEIIGVDIADEMLKIAQKKHGDTCQFVCCDVLEFLKNQPSESTDIVTCAWGLGFTQPSRLIKEVSRILKPEGQLAIIDNSIFTIYEVVISGCSTVAEHPASIINVMNVRWLPTTGSLKRTMRLSGLQIVSSWNGHKTYYAKNEADAIEFLLATGTAAGYQFCIDTQYSVIIKQRFGEIFKKSYLTEQGLPITHRFIAAIGKKPQ